MRLKAESLVPATQYAVQVRAVGLSGTASEWSERFLFTTTQNTTVPVAPTGVTWAVSDDSFVATWNEVTLDISGNPAFIDSYELELVAGATTKTVIVPAQKGMAGAYTLDFATNSGLFGTPAPAITLRVRAVNNKNIKGNFSSGLLATNAVPANVSGFSGTAGVASIDLVWTANPENDIDHYDIFVGTTAGFTPTTKIFTGKVTHFLYATGTFTAQYFKIRAVDKFGQPSAVDTQAGPYTAVSPFVADVTAPATPTITGTFATITTTANAASTTAALQWNANSEPDLAGYFVRYRVNGTTPWTVVRYDKTQTSAIVTNLTPYVNYDFQISAVDWAENMSSYSATQTGTGATNANPSTPTAPTVSTNTMQAQVTIPGTKAAGGAMEADVNYYEVYGSTTTGFTPASANMLGTVAVGPAMVQTFQIPTSGGAATETWFFKIIAVDNGGLKSSASSQTSGTPGLIGTSNIVNLAVTNAKINDLAVDKLTAGTGLATSFTVKSTLTIGDASTTGSIQSFDYSAGTAGYKISSVGGVASLEINSGIIRAPAIQLQMGPNLMHPMFADFEQNTSSYPTAGGNCTMAIDLVDFKFNKQAAKFTTSNSTNSFYLTPGATAAEFNISANPSSVYIVSYYAMVKTGATAATVASSMRFKTTTVDTSVAGAASASVPANSTWARYSTTVTAPATATGPANFNFQGFGASGVVIYIDGIQIEEKISASNTPSTWSPPGATLISGDMIRTGSLISNATTTVNATVIPFWNINATGSASFANLKVRGVAVVGVAGDDDNGESLIQSGNYVPAPDVDTPGVGWKITSDGVGEFWKVTANSFDGSAIRTKTLTASVLIGGTLNDEIALGSGTSLIANGLMGEKVGLGDYGFTVNGPKENPITNRASSGNTRTITTSVPHQFDTGSKISINMALTNGLPTSVNTDYDGVYEVLTAPTTTTFTYTAATSLTETTVAAGTGSIVQGDNSALPDGPTYINFPTDGTHPNIISGELTASNVTITEGMSIRKSSQIEQGAVLTINSVIQPPKSSPSVVQTYSDVTFKSLKNAQDLTRGFTGNYFVLTDQVSGNNYQVVEYDAAGNVIATRLSYTLITSLTHNALSLTYGVIAGTGRYYLLVRSFSQFTETYSVETYNTSWVFQGVFTISSLSPASQQQFQDPHLGWDFTNSRLICAFRNTPPANITARHYTMTSGMPSATATNVTVASSSGNGIAFIGRGDFDFGGASDKIVTKDRTASANWSVFTNTGTADATRNWPTANATTITGGYWDTTISKFVDLSASGIRRTYEGGDSFWLSTSMTDRRFIRYAWWKQTGDVETTPGPAATVDINKRARLSATIAPIPNTGGNTPDKARVYLLDNATDTYPTVTSYFLRVTVNSGSTIADIDPYTITSGTTPSATNDFAALSGNPGKIISSTGNSFWLGDDTAQFFQVVMNSTTDASTAAGNKPALRVGNVAGAHLRIDGNEILAMSSDSSQAAFALNLGGQSNVTDIQIGGNILIGGTQTLVKAAGAAAGQFASPSNVAFRVGMENTGTAIAFRATSAGIFADSYNSTTITAGNTMPFHAESIHSWAGGMFMEDLSGGGSTTATIGNGGRIVRTSSLTMKKSIKEMTKKEAHSVLGLKSYTFMFKQDSEQSPKDPRRYPGFIAEQGAEVGAELWVGRQHEVEKGPEGGIKSIKRDKNGKIIYFRTADVTVAHNALIKELFEEIESLKTELATLRS